MKLSVFVTPLFRFLFFHPRGGAGLLLALLLTASARAGDWPMWRYDAARSACAPTAPAAELRPSWACELPPLEPAWEDAVNRERMPYDRCYEPIVVGHLLIFGSSRDDLVRALDTRTGQERWRFRCDGPVRLPPAAARGRIFVISDDGFLYVLDAATGALLRKHHGAPDGRRILGNRRLISSWPARGGPVTDGAVVYYAAGIWPFMGVFLYALDAETGALRWENSTLGNRYMKQPHGGAEGFAGLAPQGALALAGDTLFVPGGRAVPAALDARTGALRYYHLSGSGMVGAGGTMNRRLEGGSHVCAGSGFFLNHRGLATTLYDARTGKGYLHWKGEVYPVLDGKRLYLSGPVLQAFHFDDLKKVGVPKKVKDRKTGTVRSITAYHWELPPRWTCKVDASGALIKAGNRLYAASGSRIVAVRVGPAGGKPGWSGAVDGTVVRLLCGDGRLFAVTLEGRIYAFGPGPETATFRPAKSRSPKRVRPPADAAALAAALVEALPVRRGYCLIRGQRSPRYARAVLAASDLAVVGLSADGAVVRAVRAAFEADGLYGVRAAIHRIGPETPFRLPPYFAALCLVESLPEDESAAAALLEAACRSVRPYGGILCFPNAGTAPERLLERLAAGGQWQRRRIAGAACMVRTGGPPGSADWTHIYADIANSAKSRDRLVRAPLGLLWFGMNSHADVLPRHAHGPPELIVGGRLFIEGVDMVSARDVYTGLPLWRRKFDNLDTFGVYYDSSYCPDPLVLSYNQKHIAGANARGANLAAASDALYLVVGGKCLALDPATGKTRRVFAPSADSAGDKPGEWGFLGVCDDLLIGGAGFVRSGAFGVKPKRWPKIVDCSASRGLVVYDRHTGRLLWRKSARLGFPHNAIVAGHGRLYCLDRLPASVAGQLARRGRKPPAQPRLLAFDLASGKRLWQLEGDRVFGTWLGYSADHDALVQCGRYSRDMTADEPRERMMLLRAADGGVIWDRKISHGGPVMLFRDRIILPAVRDTGSAVDFMSGEPCLRKHPITGAFMPWRYHRAYGCNSVIASENLLTYRSGTAAFYDLRADCGTVNLGGFKSGCTSNLIAADGVLNAPDYTRTCTCSYQNQTSLALIHMPGIDSWSSIRLEADKGKDKGKVREPVRTLGLNLGAPGDRREEKTGILWFEYPVVGGPSPKLPVTIEPPAPKTTAAYSTRVAGPLAWVGASALEGLRTLVVRCLPKAGAADERYTVRLVFADREAEPGERVFAVRLQGRTVLPRFDIAAAAGRGRTIIREFPGIAVRDVLRLELIPAAGSARPPLLSGIALHRVR